jgi:hypothetical protein
MARATRSATDGPAGTTALEASVPASVGVARATAVLGPERAGWVGEAVDGEKAPLGVDRFLLDLELRVSERAPRISFRKAAYVDVGSLDATIPGQVILPISWRAAGLQPLFPVFAGTLRWRDGVLSLDGYYAPPGGGVGIVADRLLLNVAARGTARWLLERIASAMRGEAL